MKIVKVIGGLGNQMFQYALYRGFLNLGYKSKIDITAFKYYCLHQGYELEKVFDINPIYATLEEVKKYSWYYETSNQIFRKLRKLFPAKKTEYRERTFIFDQDIYNQSSKVYYSGYWIDQRYFLDFKDDILKEFTFSIALSGKNKELFQELSKFNAVSLHIRRGDFHSKRNIKMYGNICTKEYYTEAINLIRTKVQDPGFIIFSDEMEWVKNNLTEQLGKKFVLVDWNKKDKSYIDMQLMSYCKHNIIANSTFSWWGAWLNKNKGKIVVAPKKWINLPYADQVLPNPWEKI